MKSKLTTTQEAPMTQSAIYGGTSTLTTGHNKLERVFMLPTGSGKELFKKHAASTPSILLPNDNVPGRVSSETHNIATTPKADRPRIIPATEFFAQEDSDIATCMYDAHASMWDKLEAFGIIKPKRFSPVGLMSSVDRTPGSRCVIDSYRENKYRIGINQNKKNTIIEIVFSNATGLHCICLPNLPLKTDNNAGENLYLAILDAANARESITDMIAYHLIVAGCPCAPGATPMHTLAAEFGILTRAAMRKAWLDIKTEYKHLLYASRGLYGKEEQATAISAAGSNPWFQFNLKPSNVESKFHELLASIKFLNKF